MRRLPHFKVPVGLTREARGEVLGEGGTVWEIAATGLHNDVEHKARVAGNVVLCFSHRTSMIFSCPLNFLFVRFGSLSQNGYGNLGQTETPLREEWWLRLSPDDVPSSASHRCPKGRATCGVFTTRGHTTPLPTPESSEAMANPIPGPTCAFDVISGDCGATILASPVQTTRRTTLPTAVVSANLRLSLRWM